MGNFPFVGVCILCPHPPNIEHEGEEAPLAKEAVLRYHIEQYPDPATSQSQLDRARIDKVESF